MLEDYYFTAPFKIAKPFYKEEEMKLILMSASAGIMAGDMQVFEIEIKEGGKVCFTTQSYEKLHKMEEGCGRREEIIYMDNTYYEPNEMDMSGYGMFEGESHLVNILLVNEREPKKLLEKIRQYIEDNSLDGGTSLSDMGDINVKVLGKSAQELEDIVKQIDMYLIWVFFLVL